MKFSFFLSAEHIGERLPEYLHVVLGSQQRVSPCSLFISTQQSLGVLAEPHTSCDFSASVCKRKRACEGGGLHACEDWSPGMYMYTILHVMCKRAGRLFCLRSLASVYAIVGHAAGHSCATTRRSPFLPCTSELLLVFLLELFVCDNVHVANAGCLCASKMRGHMLSRVSDSAGYLCWRLLLCFQSLIMPVYSYWSMVP